MRRPKRLQVARADHSAAAVAVWLATLARGLRVTPARRDDIVCEVDEHVHERIRELLINGLSRTEAERVTLDELGDAALVARRFTVVHTWRRRLVMRFAFIAMGAGLLLCAASVVKSPAPVGVRYFQSAPATAAEKLADTRISVPSSTTLGTFIDAFAHAAQRPVYVHWNRLAERERDRETTIENPITNVSLTTALGLVGAELFEGDGLACKVTDELIEISTRSHFDRQSRTLASYDLRDVREEGMDYDDALLELVNTMMEDAIKSNDAIHMYILGHKLFLHAPERAHDLVRWILTELRATSAEIDTSAGEALPR
ncbi:MAG: hypothetical protein ACKVX7_07320 [Planctomycetota bacterium]